MASKIADKILVVVIVILALVMLSFSGYMFFDNYLIGQNAFSSKELQAYKPTVDDEISFDMIQDVNPDTVAWLTVYDTHIDYPVVQGKDDLEYAMKNIYGKSSFTGSIYLSSYNKRDFSDKYNVIFGHHIDNNAMFGDLDSYIDEDYFLSHREGLLTIPEGNYDLKIFAYMSTHAYDKRVYYLDNSNDDTIERVLENIRQNAEIFIDDENLSFHKIIVLSTCSDLATNGRIILFADAAERSVPVAGINKIVGSTTNLKKAEGHNLSDAHWSLLNLVCVAFTVGTLVPLMYARNKFQQFQITRKIPEKLDDEIKKLKKMKAVNHYSCSINESKKNKSKADTALNTSAVKAIQPFETKKIMGTEITEENIIDMLHNGDPTKLADLNEKLSKISDNDYDRLDEFAREYFKNKDISLPRDERAAKDWIINLSKVCNVFPDLIGTINLKVDESDPQKWSIQVIKDSIANNSTREISNDKVQELINNGINERKDVLESLNRFRKKMGTGFVLEIVSVAVAVVTFCLTENIFSQFRLFDSWTWLMVLIFALVLLVDFLFFRYRGKRPADDFDDILNSKLEK